MINELIDLWNNLDDKTFYLELNNKKYFKNDLENFKNIFKKNIQAVTNCADYKIHLDIKDRFLFFIVFLSLIELKSKTVIIPSEIKLEDYFFTGGIFITDNKESNDCIFLKNDFSLKIGDNFNGIDQTEKNNTVLYLYTSGTTGKARLIPKSSINLLTELTELKKNLSICSSDIFYFTPPLYHIYGMLFGLLLPLFCSSPIILDYHFSPESIYNFIRQKNITCFISIPSYYKMFENLNLFENFKKIKRLTSSSAPLSIDVSKKFYDNGSSIVEIYGSTETGGIAYRTSAVSIEWKLFSYVKIIDQWNDYIDINKNNNAKQVEFKIVSPAISVEYDLINGFNTGDIVELYQDNKFTLLGRNTRFVKISGKRIDLNYIQEKIITLFKENYKININSDFIYVGEESQTIYAIIDVNGQFNSKLIKNDLKKHLSSYNIPKIMIFDKIPRNSMGKINKQKVLELISKKK